MQVDVVNGIYGAYFRSKTWSPHIIYIPNNNFFHYTRNINFPIQ